MDLQLKGKKALVTGSSSGLGEAIAKLLADEGAAVIIHGRDKDRAEKVMHSILKKGGSAEIAVGDLSTDDGADQVASAALKSGKIDILINNAGTTSHKSWGKLVLRIGWTFIILM
ncbi:SDR family NAD(P)-dependent oxidoreductase [Chryseobacterium sp. WLY505]|uniref:SDR family NAD(P)-dependent oxidoreductase n=1 Tax=Chryseobacterium sp. WLY505 TaxID=3068892 RepID=UPI002796B0CE|nr:SDR family NAD(P)-dependent oxidoreductase [Chryseobacterium sp. WLY505]MDQ1857289.1 SDR family NAD(P)-dependent oxidoreductase [Chryseobacterium sp. WLY505]